MTVPFVALSMISSNCGEFAGYKGGWRLGYSARSAERVREAMTFLQPITILGEPDGARIFAYLTCLQFPLMIAWRVGGTRVYGEIWLT